MKRLFVLSLLISLFLPLVCVAANDLNFKVGNTYDISKEIDLRGKELILPTGVGFNFIGGRIVNGTVRFNNTTLSGDVKIYAHIHPESTLTNATLDCSWFCPNINNGKKVLDASESINELIQITRNYTDGQYSFVPTIYLPAGIYYCHKPLNISTVIGGKDKGTRSISIRGEMGTKIVAVKAMEYLFGRPLSESTSSYSGINLTLENITFDGNLRADHTMNLSRVSNSLIKNVKSIGGCKTNLYMNYSFVDLFLNCTFRSWDVFKPTNINVFLGPQDVNAINFVGCVFEGANVGAYCGSGYCANFDGCTFEGLRRAAIYVYKTNQVNIRGCYFEENATTKNSKLRNDFDWKTFGISGKMAGGTKDNTVKVHSDVVINNYKIEPNQNWDSILFVQTTSQTKKLGEVLGNVTFIGNSVQRINSSTSDNVYGYEVTNDTFIFVADDRPVSVISNNIVSIYADEKKGVWRYSKNYKSPVLLKLQYSATANSSDATVLLHNNSSASRIADEINVIKMYR